MPTVNWTIADPNPPYRGRVYVDQSDCVLVSGTLYTLNTNTLRNQLKALEASETGIVFPDIVDSASSSPYTVAGVTYARSILFRYQVEFTPNSAWSVVLEGSNNDLWDVENDILQQNQVQVIPTNSAGLVVTGVSGLTAPESAALLSLDDRVGFLEAVARAKKTVSRIFGKIFLTDSVSGRTFEAPIYKDEAETIPYDGEGIEVQGELTETT